MPVHPVPHGLGNRIGRHQPGPAHELVPGARNYPGCFWDAELDLRRREEFAAATVEVSRGQAETAALIRLGVDAFARSFLDELARYAERGEDPFSDLTPSQKLTKLGAAARALQHAQQVERLARGLSTEHVEGRAGGGLIPPEIERKTVKELETYLLGRPDTAGEHGSVN